MAQLLRTWLEEDVRVTRPCESFETDFANGALFAEVLVRLGALPDAGCVSDAGAPAARVSNFAALAPALRSLGVALGTPLVRAIITEQRGAAMKLLHMIKSAVDARAAGEGGGGGGARGVRAPRCGVLATLQLCVTCGIVRVVVWLFVAPAAVKCMCVSGLCVVCVSVCVCAYSSLYL